MDWHEGSGKNFTTSEPWPSKSMFPTAVVAALPGDSRTVRCHRLSDRTMCTGFAPGDRSFDSARRSSRTIRFPRKPGALKVYLSSTVKASEVQSVRQSGIRKEGSPVKSAPNVLGWTGALPSARARLLPSSKALTTTKEQLLPSRCVWSPSACSTATLTIRRTRPRGRRTTAFATLTRNIVAIATAAIFCERSVCPARERGPVASMLHCCCGA
mmetsp:Transcript_10769/g.32671  ORF Transcript_10769/g.32671 Transcript_10769/m.32671 type:complete len:213 (+) Transcript_10769:738-1376(+)